MRTISTNRTARGLARNVLALLAAMLVGLVGAGEGQALTLEEALSAAYEENPTLRAARAQLRGVNEQVPQALSDWRPDVTVSASTGQNYVESKSIPDEEDNFTNPRDAQVTLSQPLYRGGRTLAGTRRAENDVRSSSPHCPARLPTFQRKLGLFPRNGVWERS